MKRHLLSHSASHACSTCSRTFHDAVALRDHSLFHIKPSLRDERALRHRCKGCWRNLFSARNARRHERTCTRAHGPPPPESTIRERKQADERYEGWGITQWTAGECMRLRRLECTSGTNGEHFFCALCACDHWK